MTLETHTRKETETKKRKHKKQTNRYKEIAMVTLIFY